MPLPRVYEGCNYLRQRLILSTLSGCPVRIKNIRAKEDTPGIQDFEASFIRLLDKLTNGSRIEINETGTSLSYHPGLISGGQITHECSLQRGIGYYLEAIICLAPFSKAPFNVTLHGITNGGDDPSVDVILKAMLPLFKHFMITEKLDMKVVHRGAPPNGGGQIVFTCPIVRHLRAASLLKPGRVKRIRGLAYALRMSPAMGNRVVEGARSVLDKFLKDVYIFTDHHKGATSGKSPGFGLSLVAETTDGVLYSVEDSSRPPGTGDITVPEDLGQSVARQLVETVWQGGCVDPRSQSFFLLMMALSPQDASQVCLGSLTPYTVEFLRHMKDFLQVVFKIEPLEAYEARQSEDATPMSIAAASSAAAGKEGAALYVLSCKGIGYTNMSKTIR
ncbi:RNA 3'-terminal phosphate cyclase-like protein [Sycon ciliatum]|uniref:RNA 3'-terminal phosphate cyclase-like protein n=1 Tax=Sycon ciliatum TaxID=27933 RepID=UPI0020AE37A1|eukprot:scpid69897/ scgid11339/ RNA 3&apos